MQGLFQNPEALRAAMETRGLFSAPPEMQPALFAQLLQQMMPQQPPQNNSLLGQITNAAKVFNPTPGRPTLPKGYATIGARG